MGIGELGNKYIHKSLTLADKWNSAIQWVQYDLYETEELLTILSAFLLPHLCLLCDIASFCNNQKSKLGLGMEGMKRKSNSGLGLLHPSVWIVRGREGQAFWTGQAPSSWACRRPVPGRNGAWPAEGGKRLFRLEPSLMSKSLSSDHAKPQEGASEGSKPDEFASLRLQLGVTTRSCAPKKPPFLIYISWGSCYQHVCYWETSLIGLLSLNPEIPYNCMWLSVCISDFSTMQSFILSSLQQTRFFQLWNNVNWRPN